MDLFNTRGASPMLIAQQMDALKSVYSSAAPHIFDCLSSVLLKKG